MEVRLAVAPSYINSPQPRCQLARCLVRPASLIPIAPAGDQWLYTRVNPPSHAGFERPNRFGQCVVSIGEAQFAPLPNKRFKPLTSLTGTG